MVDMKTAQKRLGHSDPRLTLALYVRATDEGDEEAAELLADPFSRAERQRPRDELPMREGGAPLDPPHHDFIVLCRREGGIRTRGLSVPNAIWRLSGGVRDDRRRGVSAVQKDPFGSTDRCPLLTMVARPNVVSLWSAACHRPTSTSNQLSTRS